MLSFFCSVPWSSLTSRLLHRLMLSWLLSFAVNALLKELVPFVDKTIVRSKDRVSNPPARR
jgi:hypothetical protein